MTDPEVQKQSHASTHSPHTLELQIIEICVRAENESRLRQILMIMTSIDATQFPDQFMYYYLNLFVDCYHLSSSYHAIMRHWQQYEQNTFHSGSLNICECVRLCVCTVRSKSHPVQRFYFFF